MPALQNLVLKDRTSGTPVDHTFVPRTVKDGIGTVVESSGLAITESKFSISSRSTAGGRYKVEQKLQVPIVVTQMVNGVSQQVVVGYNYASVSFDFDPLSDSAMRDNVQGMIADAQGVTKALVRGAVVNREGIWG